MDVKVAMYSNQPVLTQQSETINVRVPMSNLLWYQNSSSSPLDTKFRGPYWGHVLRVFDLYVERQKNPSQHRDMLYLTDIPAELQMPWARMLLLILLQRRASEFHSSHNTVWKPRPSWTGGRETLSSFSFSSSSSSSNKHIPDVDNPVLSHFRYQLGAVEKLIGACKTRDMTGNVINI